MEMETKFNRNTTKELKSKTFTILSRMFLWRTQRETVKGKLTNFKVFKLNWKYVNRPDPPLGCISILREQPTWV